MLQVNWDKELDEEAERQRRRKKESSESATTVLPPVKKPEVVPQLPKPRSSVSPKLTRTKDSSAIHDLLGLGMLLHFTYESEHNGFFIALLLLSLIDAPATNQTSVNGSGDDVFSSFLSAPPASTVPSGNESSNGNKTTTTSKSEEESFFDQPTPLPQEKSKMTKDSILALYGTSSYQPNVYGVPGNVYKIRFLYYLCNSIATYFCFRRGILSAICTIQAANAKCRCIWTTKFLGSARPTSHANTDCKSDTCQSKSNYSKS